MNPIVSFITTRASSARRDLTVLAITFGFAFFQFLGRFPLIEPDEGRYSEIPREMLERGDFITPFLNYVKYFEKPPLHYWLNALSFSVFGRNEFAARFPAALCGLLTVLFTYWMGRQLFERRAGLIAALVLGTSCAFMAQARINITDMTLTFFLTLCLGSFILGIRDAGPRKGMYYYLGFGSAALAVLAKGLIGIVFPGAIVFFFLLFRNRRRLLAEMRLPTGTLLFLLIAAPWFILVSVQNPEFPRFFFIHEHFERFLSKVHRRYEPFWFFIPVLLGTMLPWSLLIPEALRRAWRERRSSQGDILAYLAVWAIFIFLFFSKSSSKLVPYILPIFPPLALLIGRRINTALEEGIGSLKVSMILLTAVLMIGGIGLPLYPVFAHKDALLFTGIILGSIFLIEGVSCWRAIRIKNLAGFLIPLFLGSLWIAILGPHLIYDQMAEKRTCKDLALLVRDQAPQDAIVASFKYDQTLPFYSRRRVVVVGEMDELEFGSKRGDQSAWFIDHDQFKRLWEGNRQVYAVVRYDDLERLASTSTIPAKIVGKMPTRLLITNR